MPRARASRSKASPVDAAGACAPRASPERAVRCRLPASIPLLPDEVRVLDQLLGADIAKLFEE